LAKIVSQACLAPLSGFKNIFKNNLGIAQSDTGNYPEEAYRDGNQAISFFLLQAKPDNCLLPNPIGWKNAPLFMQMRAIAVQQVNMAIACHNGASLAGFRCCLQRLLDMFFVESRLCLR